MHGIILDKDILLYIGKKMKDKYSLNEGIYDRCPFESEKWSQCDSYRGKPGILK